MRKMLCGLGLAVVGVAVACFAVAVVYGMATVVERTTLCYNSTKCIEETGKGMEPVLRLFGGS